MICRARAHANIALVKYWGKRDDALNLPAVGSLSITLAGLTTETEAHFDPALGTDQVVLNGHSEPTEVRRISNFLQRIRERAGITTFARVSSQNNFPTGAGLASSASGFAALTLAATRAAGLVLSQAELSALARLGSGSAARSLWGGFVQMQRGVAEDGSDAVAVPLCSSAHWPLEVLVVITAEGKKATGSTSGMQGSQATSPYYEAWVETSPDDVNAAKQAVLARDFTRLATVAEHSCFKMHAVMLATQPPLLYWNPATVAVVQAVWAARNQGCAAFVTIDAGPQVKVITAPGESAALMPVLQAVPGVKRIIATGLGPDAEVLETSS